MRSDKLRVAICPIVLLLSVSVTSLQACSNSEKNKITSVTIGVLPDHEQEMLVQIYKPLRIYLQKTVGIPFHIVFVSSYEDLLLQFKDRRVDIAYFGGVTFLQAEHRYGAVPLVMRDVDVRFQTAYLVSADSPARRISDMKGKRLLFGSRLSTSGHLMPRHFMLQDDIDPESFFSDVSFSGAHDRTALSIQSGRADLGAANGAIVDKMFADGTLDKARVRILAKSPPYPDYVWAVQRTMPKQLRTKIRDAFMELTDTQPDHALILRNLQAGSFLPAVSRDFLLLREIMNEQGFL